jgi:hypothetical protein
MTQNAFVEQMREQHGEDFDPAQSLTNQRSSIFRGNSYDVAALGALASGVLVLFSCMTCGFGYYCLPFVPMLLGLIGIAAARDAIDEERTKLWSWLGIGAGVIVVLGMILGVLLSCLFFAMMASS